MKSQVGPGIYPWGLYWGSGFRVILGLYWGYIGVKIGLYLDYIGVMEKKMETIIIGFRVILGLHGDTGK